MWLRSILHLSCVYHGDDTTFRPPAAPSHAHGTARNYDLAYLPKGLSTADGEGALFALYLSRDSISII